MITESPELVELSDFDTAPPKKQYKKHYVDNTRLSAELLDWLTNDREGRMPVYVGECILKIADNIAKSHRSRGYTYIDDMKGDAILNVMKYIKSFSKSAATREGKPNAFGYISRMCENTFKFVINREKQEQYKKYASMRSVAVEDMLDENDNQCHNVEGIYASMAEKAHAYEVKNDLLKKPRKKALQVEPEYNINDWC